MNDRRHEEWENELVAKLGAEWKVVCLAEAESTMDVAKRHAHLINLNLPLLVLAERQTKGRGRQGRHWQEVGLGFYATFAFEFVCPVEHLSGLSLAVGLSAVKYFSVLNYGLRIKWPNDLLSIDGRKLGGILIELLNQNERRFILIGIGLNLVGAPAGVDEACSLHDLNAEVRQPLEIAAGLAPALAQCWQQFSAFGFAHFRKAWMEKAYGVGERFEVESAGETVRGRFVNVAADGSLELMCEDGMKTITAGHVRRIGGK